MAPNDYSHKPGGALKLKGGLVGPSLKKKKRSSTSKRLQEESLAETTAGTGSGSGGEQGYGSGYDSPSAVTGSGSGVREGKERMESPGINNYNRALESGKTPAQIRFEEVQKKRLLEKAAKMAAKTHKERVAEFNEKLEKLSEHYDIPKVGPG